MAVAALKDVCLTIPDGQFIGLIGHTGSGKSTLVQHLNGLLKPTGGAIYYNGRDIHDEDYNKKELRSKGVAERTHGGLRLPQKQPERRRYVNGTEILDEIDKEKQLIAQEAAAQVHAGESIFIGAGKTCNITRKRCSF